MRKIAPVRMVTCAAPSYLARKGCPVTPSELGNHDTLAFSYLSGGDTWDYTDAQGRQSFVRIRPHIHATNGDILRELALAGLGIIVEPTFIVDKHISDGTIIPILEDWQMEGYNLYALYLTRRFLPAKVRVFIDYLTAIESQAGS